MPQLYVYVDDFAGAADGLELTLANLTNDEIITQSQAQTIQRALEPLLPCNVRIGVRTPMSIVYCEAADRRFRVGQRGAFIPGSWRASMKTQRFW